MEHPVVSIDFFLKEKKNASILDQNQGVSGEYPIVRGDRLQDFQDPLYNSRKAPGRDMIGLEELDSHRF